MKKICYRFVRQPICLLMLFCNFKFHFHQLGSFKLIKTMLKYLNVCKVYLQYGIVIQRVSTKHGLPSIQSRMMNLKKEFAKGYVSKYNSVS